MRSPSGSATPRLPPSCARTHPPRSKQGFTVFFTGLSGSGKSTVANALLVKLLEMGGRPVTLLDGDVVRKNLCSELGFSKEHRDLNIQRIGYVASEITKNGGIAICAPIAPYAAVRKLNRELIESTDGGYILVHISTPVEVCEQRDRKGLYAKARAGIIKEFTGISDPYEVPEDADLSIDTTDITPGGGGQHGRAAPRAPGLPRRQAQRRLMARVTAPTIVARIEAALDVAAAALEPFTPGAIEARMKSGDDPRHGGRSRRQRALLAALPTRR